MVRFPPPSEMLNVAFGRVPASGTATTDSPATAPAGRLAAPSGQLAALLESQEPIEPAFVQTAARQRQQDLQHRARVEVVRARLGAGDGVPPFSPHDPTGRHFCFREQNGVLAIGSHASFLKGEEPAFVLHMHGPGMMARRDGAWVEQPDTAFFEALDAASRGAQQAFIA